MCYWLPLRLLSSLTASYIHYEAMQNVGWHRASMNMVKIGERILVLCQNKYTFFEACDLIFLHMLLNFFIDDLIMLLRLLCLFCVSICSKPSYKCCDCYKTQCKIERPVKYFHAFQVLKPYWTVTLLCRFFVTLIQVIIWMTFFTSIVTLLILVPLHYTKVITHFTTS